MTGTLKSRKFTERTCGAAAVAMIALAGGLVAGSGEATAAEALKGEVGCINSSVTGVWVQAESSTSGWAAWSVPIVLGGHSKANFSYTLNKGGRYQVHVGCGGTSKSWNVNAKSGWVSGSGKKFRCNDISPALLAAGIAVLKKNLAQGIAYKTCKVV